MVALPLPELPDSIADLRDLALDLRWTWSHEGDSLWEYIDERLWQHTRNPWLVLQSGAPTQPQFMAAVTLFLAGMGLINPIGTAIALEPFGDRAGIASALLGFLQMACAAIGTAIVGTLSVGPATAFAWVVFGGTTLAAAMFFPVLRIGRSRR